MNTKTIGYALTFLKALQDGHRNTAEIAEFHKIPLSYLMKIVSQLANAGIIETKRGPTGGATLMCDLSSVRLSELDMATTNRKRTDEPVGDLPRWFSREVSGILADALDGTTVADVFERIQ